MPRLGVCNNQGSTGYNDRQTLDSQRSKCVYKFRSHLCKIQAICSSRGRGWLLLHLANQASRLLISPVSRERDGAVARELFWAMPGRGAHDFIHFILTTKSRGSTSMQRRLRNIDPGWAAASHRQRCPAEEKRE